MSAVYSTLLMVGSIAPILTNSSLAGGPPPGPSVALNGIDSRMAHFATLRITDGVDAKLAWTYSEAPTTAVAEVWMLNVDSPTTAMTAGKSSTDSVVPIGATTREQMIKLGVVADPMTSKPLTSNDSPSTKDIPVNWGYVLTPGTSQNLASDQLAFKPRAYQRSGEHYILKVIWRDGVAFFGVQLAEVQTPPFSVIMKSPRHITLEPCTVLGHITGQGELVGLPIYSVSLNTENLPVGAQIKLWAQPSWDPWKCKVQLATISDTHGCKPWQPLNTPPGLYYLTAYYVNEYRIWSMASSPVNITFE